LCDLSWQRRKRRRRVLDLGQKGQEELHRCWSMYGSGGMKRTRFWTGS
jgi:hypothetical protein